MKLVDLFEQQNVIKGDVYAKQLDYAGVIVKGNFVLQLTVPNVLTLDGAPLHVDGDFDCSVLTTLKTLKGGPVYVGGRYDCTTTGIKSLEGVSEYVGKHFNCWNTPMTSLKNVHRHVKHIGDTLFLPKTVRSRILGVMLIKGLQKIDFTSILLPGVSTKQKNVQQIINKHLAGNRNVHEAHEELLEAGLEEYAQL